MVTDGPARSAMAAAVRTKRPAQIMAPMPSATSDTGPSVRLRGVAPLSACRRSIDFVLNNELATISLSISLGIEIHKLHFAAYARCAAALPLRDHTRYTGIPSSTMIRPGHVYCGL